MRITIDNWVFLEADNRAIKLLLTRLAVFADADLAVSLRALLAGFFDSEVAGSIESSSLDADLAVTLGTWVLDGWVGGGLGEVSTTGGSLADLALSFFTLLALAIDAQLADGGAADQLTRLADFFALVISMAELALLTITARILRRELLEWSEALSGRARLARATLAQLDFARLVLRAGFADVGSSILASCIESSSRVGFSNCDGELVAQLGWLLSRDQHWRMRVFVRLWTDLGWLFFLGENTTGLGTRSQQS